MVGCSNDARLDFTTRLLSSAQRTSLVLNSRVEGFRDARHVTVSSPDAGNKQTKQFVDTRVINFIELGNDYPDCLIQLDLYPNRPVYWFFEVFDVFLFVTVSLFYVISDGGFVGG